MPLTLPDNQQKRIFIIGKDAKGVLGATLDVGQTCTITSADPDTVLITHDPTPVPTLGVDGVPDGTPTVASAIVDSPATVANPDQPIDVHAQVNNADGSPADSADDTVTIAPGTQESIGEAFGAAQAVSAPVPAAKK